MGNHWRGWGSGEVGRPAWGGRRLGLVRNHIAAYSLVGWQVMANILSKTLISIPKGVLNGIVAE